jgi:predicted nucleic acid-binding protein
LKFLLDTNVISEIRKRERAHPNVVKWVDQTPVKDIGTSVVVIAEIRRGIELKRRTDPAQAEALDRWYAQMRTRLGERVLPIDEPIAEAWAHLSVPHPLPLVDGLLAATCKVRGLTLVTRNTADIARTGVAFLDPFAGPVGGSYRPPRSALD